MLLASIILIASLVVLSWSADRLVFGASALAANSGVKPIIIGLTIVAMGSSAPEIVVSATASFEGRVDTAVGNALGSNITNIALVLGITTLYRVLNVSSLTLRRELPIFLLVSAFASYLISDGEISYIDGVLLTTVFFSLIAATIWIATNTNADDPLLAETEDEIPTDVSTPIAILWVVVGLVLLLTSAQFLVDSAVVIAKYFGLSDLIIGLTVIAIGTSLPELAASIAAARKGEHDLVIGNIVGSNIFNLGAVLGMPGLIAPGMIDPEAVNRDIMVMLGLSVLLLLFSFNFTGTQRINRLEGFVLLSCFFAYQYWLFVA